MTIRRHPGILLLFLLACHLSAAAQQHDKTDEPKPDTTMADTIVVGGEEPGLQTHVDTTFPASPELGNATPPADQLPVLRHLPDTTVARWQHDPRFAYANDPEYWKIRREKPSSFGIWLERVLRSEGFKYTVLFLLGGLLLFAIVRIAMENNLTLFYRRTKKRTGEGTDAEGLPPQEDIDERIRHFLETGDKRQATRYLYLKSLHLLGDRDLIRWHAETTNQQYLHQLKGTPQEPAFRFLTLAYEMVWYGDFVLSESSFQRLYQRFTEFFKTLEA